MFIFFYFYLRNLAQNCGNLSNNTFTFHFFAEILHSARKFTWLCAKFLKLFSYNISIFQLLYRYLQNFMGLPSCV